MINRGAVACSVVVNDENDKFVIVRTRVKEGEEPGKSRKLKILDTGNRLLLSKLVQLFDKEALEVLEVPLAVSEALIRDGEEVRSNLFDAINENEKLKAENEMLREELQELKDGVQGAQEVAKEAFYEVQAVG